MLQRSHGPRAVVSRGVSGDLELDITRLQRSHGPRAVVSVVLKQRAWKACLKALFEQFDERFGQID